MKVLLRSDKVKNLSKLLIKQLTMSEIPDILPDIFEIILKYEKSIFDNIRINYNKLWADMAKRRYGVRNRHPDCCTTFFVLSRKPRYIIDNHCSINQRIAIRRILLDYNNISYTPCEECAIKILNGINTISPVN